MKLTCAGVSPPSWICSWFRHRRTQTVGLDVQSDHRLWQSSHSSNAILSWPYPIHLFCNDLEWECGFNFGTTSTSILLTYEWGEPPRVANKWNPTPWPGNLGIWFHFGLMYFLDVFWCHRYVGMMYWYSCGCCPLNDGSSSFAYGRHLGITAERNWSKTWNRKYKKCFVCLLATTR